MALTRVALLWHHHQPFYEDLRTGVSRMPWVRLHGTKDYYGMARLLADAGGAVKATVNLVPSLLDQLVKAAAGESVDPHLTISRKPAEELDPEERGAALTLYFQANAEHMIGPWPRYEELFRKRQPRRLAAEDAVPEFTVADLRDLQVWGNLAWFHRTLIEEEPLLLELVAKGRGFTEEEKAALLELQREVLGRVLPLHVRLRDEGTIAIAASPYYHPILPLLVDMESAHVAMPGTPLPAERRPLPEDAAWHLTRAVERHRELLGRRPTGLWPSEGSVSPGILPLVKGAGFDWLATDEGVLAASLGADYAKDALYRPWRIDTPGGPLAFVFRDHTLSDLVSFDYQRMEGGTAARDFVARIREIGRRHGPDALVTVILDGENPWEHYPGGGLGFLRPLYRELAAADDIETVLLDEELAARPPANALPRLHSGSWIHANFAIWIGHEEDVRAWEYVFRVREDLVRFEADAAPEDAAIARRCLYAAEGSDWTWWYGADHSSGQDEVFDEIFRNHLANVYRCLGREVPAFLAEPVSHAHRRDAILAPVGFLDVTLDGRETSYFEWLAAGRYRVSETAAPTSEGGAMSRFGATRLAEFRFGFDRETLLLRVDPRVPFAPGLRVVFRFSAPDGRVIVVEDPGGPAPRLLLDGALATGGSRAAVGTILEVAVPFAVLELGPGDPVALRVELYEGETLFERLPGAEEVGFAVPTADFEVDRWHV